MLIETLSVFPEMFEPVMSTSILGRARKAGLFDFKAYNLRGHLGISRPRLARLDARPPSYRR